MISNSKEKTYLLYSQFILLFFYFFSTLQQNHSMSIFFSSLIAIFASVIIFISTKEYTLSKVYAFLLSFACFMWGSAGLLWLMYTNLFSINPDYSINIKILHQVPNLICFIFLAIYIYKNHSYWNQKQLFIDIFTFIYINVLLLWSYFFAQAQIDFGFNFDYVFSIVNMFINILNLALIATICFTKKFNHMHLSLSLILITFTLIAVADFYSLYLGLINVEAANPFINIIYVLCIFLFSIAATYEAMHPTPPETMSRNNFVENTKKPNKLIILYLVLPSILFLLKFLNFTTFIFISTILILYWNFRANVHSNILGKILLKSEKEMNEHLENLVQERTMELSITNKYLEEISNIDPLTGLSNRKHLLTYLKSLLSSDQTASFALLYIDTNRFKHINDSCGHEIGDGVLSTLGMRFSELTSADCLTFRIGNDEFAVILHNFKDKNEISTFAEKILEQIQLPILIPPYSFTLGASIGIAVYPTDTKKKDILMRYADIAMNEIKASNHKNDYLFFDKAFTEKINKRQELEFLLQNADYDKEFQLYFQPQYHAEKQTLVGMEALIRWIHPEKGFIPPSDFIPIAEENGLIVEIGEWVINRAFTQIKQWNETLNQNFRMSINISPIQIKNTAFLERFTAKLESYGVNPEWIDLEITESVAMISTATIENIFHSFNTIGLNISIDDFGTGYSSLSYIRKYEIDRLKIAKELIDNIDHDENALLIVQAIIMMAKGLHLTTLSEGVEEPSQLAILNSLGCDEIQGYIFGKPVPSDEFEKLHFQGKDF